MRSKHDFLNGRIRICASVDDPVKLVRRKAPWSAAACCRLSCVPAGRTTRYHFGLSYCESDQKISIAHFLLASKIWLIYKYCNGYINN